MRSGGQRPELLLPGKTDEGKIRRYGETLTALSLESTKEGHRGSSYAHTYSGKEVEQCVAGLDHRPALLCVRTGTRSSNLRVFPGGRSPDGQTGSALCSRRARTGGAEIRN